MDFKIKDVPTKYLVILGVIVLLLLSSLAGSLWQNRGLKNDIKERDKKIEQIDREKKPIFKEIEADKSEIKKRDSVILVLSNKQKALEKTIQNLRYENNRIKDAYINNPIDERVHIFARLATEKDSTR